MHTRQRLPTKNLHFPQIKTKHTGLIQIEQQGANEHHRARGIYSFEQYMVKVNFQFYIKSSKLFENGANAMPESCYNQILKKKELDCRQYLSTLAPSIIKKKKKKLFNLFRYCIEFGSQFVQFGGVSHLFFFFFFLTSVCHPKY